MPSIDERVVSMAFENTAFEQRVAVTMATLSKLNDAIAKTGTGPNGLENIEKSANKVTLEAPMSALDKLRARFSRGVDSKPIEDIEKSGNKVTLEQPTKAIDNLQNKLDKTNAGTTFTDMENAGNRINLGGLTNALDGIKTHLSGIETAAAVAFGNLASRAAMAGGSFAKSFTLAPIKAGFDEYKTNLQAVQTIQANTDQPLPKINKALQDLNHYSDLTIYNFGEMARNIGTFTAAGVDLKNATSSIKGIANMAALSGSTSQQASTAMYQLSQSIASGKVGLQDWNSVVNAGMGGKKLQSALATTAIAMGGIKDSSVKLEGPLKKLTIGGKSFRESIQSKPGSKPWLTSEVLVNTLASLDGRFSKAALGAELTSGGLKKYTAAQIEAKIADSKAAMEKKNGVKYTDAQFAALSKLSDSAFKSATQVKTLGQVFDVAKEAMGSGWSASFVNIFGTLGEAKKTFTGMSNAINGMINASALARNKVLSDWKKLGGRNEAIEGIKQAFEDVMKVLGVVKDAFREVFPAKTGKDLFEMSKSFHEFMKTLEPSKATLEGLKNTFAGVFAAVHIGWTIIKSLGKVVFDLLGIVGKGSGGFLNFTGGIGKFLVAIDKAVSKGGALTGFFKGLTNVLRVPLELVKALVGVLAGLFGGVDTGNIDRISTSTGKVIEVLTPMEKIVDKVKGAWAKLTTVFAAAKDVISPWLDKVVETFKGLGGIIGNAISGMDFGKVLLAFQTTLLGGIFITLKKALGGGKGGFDITKGVFGQVKGVLEGVTGQLTAMQNNVKASMILKIAGAVVLLAAGIYIISTIPADKLAKSMTAIAVGLGELGAVLKVMSAGAGITGAGGMVAIAGGMVILALAVVILAGAMKIIATMSWEEIGKGLTGMAGALGILGGALAAIYIFVNPAAVIPIAAGLLLMAGAMVVMAIALKIFSDMSWTEIAKGLIAMAGSLAILTVAMIALGIGLSVAGPIMLLAGPAIAVAAFGLILLAGAVSAFGALDMASLGKGMLGMVASLAILTVGLAAFGAVMYVLGPTLLLFGPTLILGAIGLTMLAGAVGAFGKLKLVTLGKGLLGMVLSLAVLAAALFAFGVIMAVVGPIVLLAAPSLVIAAFGLGLLATAIGLFGSMDFGTTLKGIGIMAIALGALGVMGLVAAPGIIALGAALAVFGLALLEIGAAVYLAAKGLALLGDSGAKGLGVFITALTAFIALFPSMVISFVKGLLVIAEELAKIAPKVLQALGIMIDMVIAFVIKSAPKLAVAIGTLIASILLVISQNSGPIIQAGWGLVQKLLDGISSNIGSVVTKVGDIIVKFLNALTVQYPRIIQAGAKTLGAFLGGIATAIPTLLTSAAKVVSKFLEGVTKQLPGVITKGAALIMTFLNEIIKHVPDFVKAGGRLIVAIIGGIGDNLVNIVKAGGRLIIKFVDGIANTLPKVVNAGFDAIVKFLHGIADAIRTHNKPLLDAGADILHALIDGVTQAAGRLAGPLKKAIEGLFGMLPHWAKKILGISSPSAVFAEIGGHTISGFIEGIDGGHKSVMDSAAAIGNGVIGTFKDVLGVQSPSKVLKEIGKEVGTGFKQGLDGSTTDIKNAFSSLKEKIKTEMANERQAISEEHAKLRDLEKQHSDKLAEIRDLNKHPKKNKDAISTATDELHDIEHAIGQATTTIGRYNAALSALSNANTTMKTGLTAEKAELIGLSKEYDTVSESLDKANQALVEATQTRDNAIKSYTEQFSKLPDTAALLSQAMQELTDAEGTLEEQQKKAKEKADEEEKRRKVDQVANYKAALREQIRATIEYEAILKKLRDAGLDDTTYKKLLESGLDGKDFAEQLLMTGKSGIAELNKMDSDLLNASTDLAKAAADKLYQSGVAAAQGLVDGLISRKHDLEVAMDGLAAVIVNRIRAALGIASPSKVFAKIGKFAADGLAKGLKDSSTMVTKQAAIVGDEAAKALANSLADIRNRVAAEIDTDITITPVLDLSQVKKEAENMPSLAPRTMMGFSGSGGTSYNAASSISSAASQASSERSVGMMATPSFSYIQNNYSPKALSDIEVYRQTNNLLSNVKRGLGLPGRVPAGG